MTRIPPHDLECEAAVLAAVLLDPRCLDDMIPILSCECFYSNANKIIYSAMVDLHSAGGPVDVLTIKGRLEDKGQLGGVGGSHYLMSLVGDVPAVHNLEQYALRIVDKHRLRELISTCQHIAAGGYTADDTESFLDSAERAVFAATSRRETRPPQRLRDALRSRFRKLQEQAKSGAPTLLTTGLRDVDDKLTGLQPGDLCVIAARPGLGKTSFGVNNIAVHCAEHGHGVGIFSLEMQRERLVDRLLCSGARVNSRNIPVGLIQRDEWSRLAAEAGRLSGMPIIIDDEPAIQMNSLRAKARRMASSFAADGIMLSLIIVDYLQLMGTNPSLSTREERVAENSRGLKALAKDMGCVVVALAQLNRSIESRGKKAEPMLSDLRESGAIEQDADSIIFLHNTGDREAKVKVAKNRNFATGNASVLWVPARTVFEDLPSGWSPAIEDDY